MEILFAILLVVFLAAEAIGDALDITA